MKRSVPCAWCGKPTLKEARDINRARKSGRYLYCDKICSGFSRRSDKTKQEKVADKAEYDREYREKNLARIKAQKAAYFQATYDPDAARVQRKENMPRHLEYCRTPKYKQKKRSYDVKHRAEKFGEFAEAYMLLSDIDREIATSATRYEIYSANGTLNKSLQRKRQYGTSSD